MYSRHPQRSCQEDNKKAYVRNITHWKDFLQSRSIADPSLDRSGTWTKEDQTGIIVLYMDFLRKHHRQPNISNCMVALSDHLRMNMADESIIHNWIIRGASKSLTRQNGNELSLLKEKRVRLPTPFDFMKHIIKTYMSQPLCWDTCDDYMTGLANMLAFEFGLRVSEYCYNKDTEDNHAIMGTDVYFDITMVDGITKRLTSWQLTTPPKLDQIDQVECELAKNYPNDDSQTSLGIHPSSVTLIHLLLRSQKNHQDGSTRSLVLRRNYQHPTSPINNLMYYLVTFAKFSKVGPEDPFFSRWKGKRKVLHRRMVSKMLKDTAKELGYPEKNLGTRLRTICSRIYTRGHFHVHWLDIQCCVRIPTEGTTKFTHYSRARRREGEYKEG